MTKLLIKEAAIEYQRRWRAVHEAEIEEIRRTALATRLRQLSVLMESSNLFPIPPHYASQDIEALNRWNWLRRHYGKVPSSLT
jgi:hypothetical protein